MTLTTDIITVELEQIPVALSGGTLYQADFGQLKAATSSAIAWQSVGQPGFKTSNYSPVMALAQNHIFFFDTPGASADELFIFVIHCEYSPFDTKNNGLAYLVPIVLCVNDSLVLPA